MKCDIDTKTEKSENSNDENNNTQNKRVRGRGRGIPRKEPPSKNKKQTIEILSYISSTSNDTLTQHISKYQLNLERVGFVPGNGDCFYTTIFNLCEHHGLKIPAQNALELRRYVVEHINQHPQFNDWLRTIWGSQVRKFNDFVKLHLKSGVYTDNYGIVLYTTQHLLKITIHLVSSNNNDKKIPSQ